MIPKPTKGVILAPWTDEEIETRSQISEGDVKFCLATSTPAVRAMLTARTETVGDNAENSSNA